jgi:hypothetical protein
LGSKCRDVLDVQRCLARHAGWVGTAILVIVAIALYCGLFRAVGGFGAAAAALRRWGEISSTTHARAPRRTTTRTTSST